MYSHIKGLIGLLLLCSFLNACGSPEDEGSLIVSVSLNNQTAQTVVVEYRQVGTTDFETSRLIEAGENKSFFMNWNSECLGNPVAEANIYTADSERTLLKSVTDPSEFRKEPEFVCSWVVDLK